MSRTKIHILLSTAAIALLASPAYAQSAGIPVTISRTGALISGNAPVATGPHTIGDSGKPVGLTRQVISFSSSSPQGAGITIYYPCMGFISAAGGAEPNIKQPWALAGTFKSFSFQASPAPGAGQSFVATLRIDRTATPVTCPILGVSTSCSAANATAASIANQTCDIQVVSSAGAAAARMSATGEFDNG